MNQIGRSPGFETICRGSGVAVVQTILCAQDKRVTNVFDGQGVLIG
jgi:hypothetical protein